MKLAEIAVALIITTLGTNFAGYYSVSSPYLGLLLLAAGSWAALSTYHYVITSRGFRLRLTPFSFAWVCLIALPLALMLLSDRSFDRSAWFNQIFVIVSLIFGIFAGGNKSLHLGIAGGAMGVVFVCAGLNLIEHFLYPDTWSTATGRSAGWLLNPNLSAAALTGYAIIYIFARPRAFSFIDIPVLLATAAGTLVTFSRAGYVLVVVAVMAYFLARLDGRLSAKYLLRLSVSAVALVSAAAIVLPSLIDSLNLSADTYNRFAFLIGEGQRDQSINGREQGAEVAWYEYHRHPLTGIGVRVTYDLPTGTGPHNMYASLAMDTGFFPLALYVGLILVGLLGGLNKLLRVSAPESRVLLSALIWLGLNSFASHNVLTSNPDVLVIGLALGIASAASKLPSATSPIRGQQRIRQGLARL